MELKIELAEDFTEVKDFVCGVDELDENKHLWSCYSEHHLAVFYFVRDCVSKTVIAVFALQNDSLVLDSDEKEDMKSGIVSIPHIQTEDFYDEFFSRRDYPATELALLVVDKSYQRKGVGQIVVTAIFEMLRDSSLSGCVFMTVEAISVTGYSTCAFYRKLGFSNCFPVPRQGTLRMYAPLYPEHSGTDLSVA